MRSFKELPQRRLFRLLVVLAGCVGFLALFLKVEFSQSQRLQAARATWESKAINSYRMIVEVADFPTQLATRYSITIFEGEVIEAHSQGMLMFPAYDSNRPPDSDVSLQSVTGYTVDEIFKRAAIELADAPAIHFVSRANCGERVDEIEYDIELGYIKSLIRSCTGCQLGDCGVHFYRVIDIEIVDRPG